MPEALTVFLWVASVCMVILTVMVVALATALIYVAIEARRIARRTHQELLWWIDGRRRLINRMRFAQKWARIMGERFIG
jgi:hypothetical protein